MEMVWQDYQGDENIHVVNGSTFDESWSHLNGTGWRTYFDPPLTYWLSISTELFFGQYMNFGCGYVPHNVIIGKDYKVFHNDVGFTDELIRARLDEAIEAWSEDTEPPVFVRLLDNIASVGEDIDLLLNINDISNIDSAVAYYDLGSGLQELVLQEVEDRLFPYTFTGNIPAVQEELQGTIYFEIEDEVGNLLISEEFEIGWIDGIVPWQLQFCHEYDMNSEIGPATGGEFDGEFFYTAHLYESYICKYNADGDFLGEYPISGVIEVRDLAWDGQFLYGSRANDQIWKIDPQTMTLAGTIFSQEGAYRALAYDDDLDGFWGNNYDGDIVCTGRNGATIDIIEDPGPMHIYGMAYDNFSDGGPFLWVFDVGEGFSTPQLIRQINIASGQFTGVEFDVSSRLGAGLAKGLFITDQYENGVITIGGIYTMGSGYYADHAIFGLTLTESTVDVQNDVVEVSDLLLTNYPNPFNPNTTISFSTTTRLRSNDGNYAGQAENTELCIYNIKGQKIKTFTFPNGQGMHPGKSLGTSEDLPFSHSPYHSINEVLWNGTNNNNQPVPSGIYFYKLRSGSQEISRKMLLLK